MKIEKYNFTIQEALSDVKEVFEFFREDDFYINRQRQFYRLLTKLDWLNFRCPPITSKSLLRIRLAEKECDPYAFPTIIPGGFM